MASDRKIAGIRCSEILSELSNYLAGELPDDVVSRVDQHLAACTWCEHFGGEFAAVVKAVKDQLGPADSPKAEETDALISALELE